MNAHNLDGLINSERPTGTWNVPSRSQTASVPSPIPRVSSQTPAPGMPRVPPARLGLWRLWKAKLFRSRILFCHPAIGSASETSLHPIGMALMNSRASISTR